MSPFGYLRARRRRLHRLALHHLPLLPITTAAVTLPGCRTPPYCCRTPQPCLAFARPGFWVTPVIAPDADMGPAPPRRCTPRPRAVPSPPRSRQRLRSLRWARTSLPQSWVPPKPRGRRVRHCRTLCTVQRRSKRAERVALGGDKGQDMPGPAPSPAHSCPPVPRGHPGPSCPQGRRGELQVSACRSRFALQVLSWHLRSLGSAFSDEGP